MGTHKGRVSGRLGLNARDERGATAVEYGLMVAFIALVIIASVTAFGKSVLGLFELITTTAPFN
jgi:pilus assembly protein Flp/PilA